MDKSKKITVRPYDDKHQKLPPPDNIIGTVLQTFSRSALNNGWKLLIQYGDKIKF